MSDRFDWPRRLKAAGLHLLISLVVAAAAGALVFGVWYPGAYRLLAGGRELFFLVTSVDVVLGPLLTFAVFNLKKGWPHLRRDLAVIALLQLAALVYGMHTVYVARPVAMVFEVDRFRVITAGQVYLPELDKARPEYQTLPLAGPWLLGTRAAESAEERNDALFKGTEGIDVAQRPIFWQPYPESVARVLAHARPLDLLLAHYSARADEIKMALQALQIDPAQARFLPVMARGGDWVAILDAAGRPVHFVRADGFF